jgi:aryl-alcohol dehydrogenase-like predicted oxidoreductase
MGIADIGVKTTEEEGFELLDAFVEAGGTFIDTARVYSNWVPGELSRSERILGDWLQARNCRDRMVLATKGGHPPLDAMHQSRLGFADVQEDVDGSLRSLRVDTVDLYYLHRDDPARPVGEVIDTLEEFVAAGKIRYYACSNWSAQRIEQALDYARSKGSTGFVANQMRWNIGSRNSPPGRDTTMVAMDEATLALHRTRDIAAVPYASQAGGFFTKLDVAGGVPDERLAGRAFCNDANLALYGIIRELARSHDCGVTQIVLSYLLSQPFPTIPVFSCRTPEQLQDTLESVSVTLSPGEMARLEEYAGGTS